MAQKSNPGTSKRERKVIWIVAAAAAAAAIVIFVVALSGSSAVSVADDLPPDERFIRETVNSFDPTQSTLERLAAVQTALTTLDKLPRARREAVIIEAMAAGVNNNLENFRSLPDADKPARAKLLYEDALQTRQHFRSLTPQERRRAKELLGDAAGGRAQLDRAINTVLNGMTSGERAMLNPVFVVWKSMLEEP